MPQDFGGWVRKAIQLLPGPLGTRILDEASRMKNSDYAETAVLEKYVRCSRRQPQLSSWPTAGTHGGYVTGHPDVQPGQAFR